MKKFDTSAAVGGNILFTKTGTFEFLQLAYQEGLDAIIKNLIGPSYSSTRLYRLWGCQLTFVAGVSQSITAGAIFLNGEIFQVDAQSTTFAISEGFQIITTQYTINADPTDFSDGIQRNVHNIRKIGLLDGAASPMNALFDIPQKEIQTNFFSAFGAPEVINLDRNKINYYDTSPSGAGSPSILLGGTTPGAKCVIIFATLSGSCSFNITSSGTYEIIIKNGSPSYSGSGASFHTIEIQYLGQFGTTKFFTVEYGLD